MTVSVVERGPDRRRGRFAVLAEGEELTRSISFTDAGALDTHTVTVNWGDGTASRVPGNGHIAVRRVHTFAVTGSHTVEVCVTDDDSGETCETFQVRSPRPRQRTTTPSRFPKEVVTAFSTCSPTTPIQVVAHWCDRQHPTRPGTGTVDCGSDDCTYTPGVGFVGEASFEYTMSNGAVSDSGHGDRDRARMR